MRSRTLARRYAQGLISSAEDKEEFDSLCADLRRFDELLSSSGELKKTLISPLLPAFKKEEIADLILERIPLGGKIKRFLLLLVENNRLTLLHEIQELLPLFWNEEHGIVTFEVRSVVPLDESQKKRLEEKMAALEQCPVDLSFKIEPALIGGLSIKKGNIVYDVSIQGDLERLKQKIVEE